MTAIQQQAVQFGADPARIGTHRNDSQHLLGLRGAVRLPGLVSVGKLLQPRENAIFEGVIETAEPGFESIEAAFGAIVTAVLRIELQIRGVVFVRFGEVLPEMFDLHRVQGCAEITHVVDHLALDAIPGDAYLGQNLGKFPCRETVLGVQCGAFEQRLIARQFFAPVPVEEGLQALVEQVGLLAVQIERVVEFAGDETRCAVIGKVGRTARGQDGETGANQQRAVAFHRSPHSAGLRPQRFGQREDHVFGEPSEVASPAPFCCRKRTTFCTSNSGAEAPAVTPMRCLPSSHSRRMSDSLSIR